MKIIEQNEWKGRALTVTWDDAPTLPTREQITQASGVCFVGDDDDNDNGGDEPLIVLVGSGDGRWSLPGGHPEAGETAEAAFRREVLEEACAVVEECGYLGAQRVDDFADNDAGSIPYYQTRFWARVRLLPFEPQHETTERRLVRPDTFVATLNWNTSKTAQAILDAALQRRLEAATAPYALLPATQNDLPFLYDIVRATMRGHVKATWGAWDEAWQSSRFSDHFPPERWQVIFVDGALAGGIDVEERNGVRTLANLPATRLSEARHRDSSRASATSRCRYAQPAADAERAALQRRREAAVRAAGLPRRPRRRHAMVDGVDG